LKDEFLDRFNAIKDFTFEEMERGSGTVLVVTHNNMRTSIALCEVTESERSKDIRPPNKWSKYRQEMIARYLVSIDKASAYDNVWSMRLHAVDSTMR
jgi:hypothetical protein